MDSWLETRSTVSGGDTRAGEVRSVDGRGAAHTAQAFALACVSVCTTVMCGVLVAWVCCGFVGEWRQRWRCLVFESAGGARPDAAAGSRLVRLRHNSDADWAVMVVLIFVLSDIASEAVGRALGAEGMMCMFRFTFK
jgi:hypothetical protein